MSIAEARGEVRQVRSNTHTSFAKFWRVTPSRCEARSSLRVGGVQSLRLTNTLLKFGVKLFAAKKIGRGGGDRTIKDVKNAKNSEFAQVRYTVGTRAQRANVVERFSPQADSASLTFGRRSRCECALPHRASLCGTLTHSLR